MLSRPLYIREIFVRHVFFLQFQNFIATSAFETVRYNLKQAIVMLYYLNPLFCHILTNSNFSLQPKSPRILQPQPYPD